MKIVLQRVQSASVQVDNKIVSQIQQGYLLLIGVGSDDTDETITTAVNNVLKLRLLTDANGKMGVNIIDGGGDILAVSQFTLYADFSKGNRPSFHQAATPDVARPLFTKFINALENGLGRKVAQGVFGADMKVTLCNDGPVTVIL
jgi:D-tyrosyl-tRNA(Tyr) deacylase